MNTEKVRQIEFFTKFMDFLENPEEYRQLIKDMHVAVKEHDRMVLEARNIRDFDVWKNGEIQKLTDKEAKLAKRSAELDAHAETVKEADARAAAAETQLKADVAAWREEFLAEKKRLGDLQAEKERLSKYSASLDQVKLELEESQKEFDRKKAALEAAMKG